MALNAFRLLNGNRPPSVAFTVVCAAVSLDVSDTMGLVKDFMVLYWLCRHPQLCHCLIEKTQLVLNKQFYIAAFFGLLIFLLRYDSHL